MKDYYRLLSDATDEEESVDTIERRKTTTKEYLLQLCGPSIKRYIRDDDLVCMKCTKYLKLFVEMRNKTYEVIVKHYYCKVNGDDTPTNLLSFSNDYTSNVRNSNDSEGIPSPSTIDHVEARTPLNSPVPPYRSVDDEMYASPMTSSPRDLLIPTRSVDYDQRSDTPMIDMEVHYTNFTRRRRRKGHGWTRRKGSQSRNRSRSASVPRSRSSRSNGSSRSVNRVSRRSEPRSYTSVADNNLTGAEGKDYQRLRILAECMYRNPSLSEFTHQRLGTVMYTEQELKQILSKGVAKTRFATELRQKILTEYERYCFECQKDMCGQLFCTIEELTNHLISEHNEPAWFICEQCKLNFVTREHLEKHIDKHNENFERYCICCSEMFTDKRLFEKHLEEHMSHSFPCIYCDTFYLTKQKCENHIREKHPGKKKKIKRIKPQSILDRIDKNEKNQSSQLQEAHYNEPAYTMKVLRQPGPVSNQETDTIPSFDAEGYQEKDLDLFVQTADIDADVNLLIF